MEIFQKLPQEITCYIFSFLDPYVIYLDKEKKYKKKEWYPQSLYYGIGKGIYKEWYTTRSLEGELKLEYTLQNGLKEGPYKEYTLDKECIYVPRPNAFYWVINGRIKEVGTYTHGLKEGPYEKWYQKQYLKLNLLNDTGEKLYRAGKLCERGSYKNGKIYKKFIQLS